METISSLCTEHPEFRERWVSLFRPADMQYLFEVRLRCDSIFQDEIWKCFGDIVRQGISQENMKSCSKQLFQKIIQEMQYKAEMCESNIPDKMSIDVLILTLQRECQEDPSEFILQLVQCFEKEQELIDSYTKMEEDSHPDSSITLMDKVRDVESSAKIVDDETRKLTELTATEDERKKELTEKKSSMRQLRSTNGISTVEANGIKTELENLRCKINESKMKIQNALDDLASQASEVLGELKDRMKSYRKKQQLHYVDLEQKPTIPMEAETGFSTLGKLFYDLLSSTIPKLHAICDRFVSIDRLARIQEIFQDLLQSSFIVTDQVRHVIKVELGSKKRSKEGGDKGQESCGQKFKCPTFRANVRMLAGKFIESKRSVRAQFCQEGEVNTKFREKKWNKPCEFKLKPKVDEAPFDKKKDIASFTRMELERFERTADKVVCEDKFRIVFDTKMKVSDKQYEIVNDNPIKVIKFTDSFYLDRKFKPVNTTEYPQVIGKRCQLITLSLSTGYTQTISLPIVVTTGASQGCNVHGSLLWQCFSTEDVFSMPIEPIVSLPWEKLFEMLNAKFQMLDGRCLREDEKCYLGIRLTGEEVVTNETEIPFRKFCVDKMMDIKENDDKKKSATFWMWFLAVYNLTKIHLKEYWKLESDDDIWTIASSHGVTLAVRMSVGLGHHDLLHSLIFGFISKRGAEEKLRELRDVKPHTYMLRFSEKIITDGQGQNVCGALSAAFVYNSRKGIRIKHTDPFKAETFKKQTLAQCVKNTMGKECDKPEPLLQWLYPGNKSTNDAFESFHAETLSKGNTGYELLETLLLVSFNDMSLSDDNGQRRKKIATKRTGRSRTSDARQTKSRKSTEPEVKIEQPDSSPPQASYSPYEQQPSIPSIVQEYDSDSQTSISDSVSSSCLNDIPSVASNASSESACSIQYPLNPTLQLPPQNMDGKQHQFPTLTKLLQGPSTVQNMPCPGALTTAALDITPVSQSVEQYQKMDLGFSDGTDVCSTSNPVEGQIVLNSMETTSITQQDKGVTPELQLQMEQFRQLSDKINSPPEDFDLASHGITMATGLPLKNDDSFLDANMMDACSENVPSTPEILDISHSLLNGCPQNVSLDQDKTTLESQSGTEMEGNIIQDPNQILVELMSRRDSDPQKVQLVHMLTQVLSTVNTCINQSGETTPSQIFQDNFPES